MLCVRDACHWVRCISGQSDRRSVEEDTKEGEQQQQQQPNESASDDKWRYMYIHTLTCNADLRSWDGEASTSDVGKKKALVETK